jgi:asparagine synthase (glutamine-hydrolysing)
MYAFALHDAQQDEVLLARDPLGMKPLYCHEGSSGVRFASEIKALLALLPQQPDLSPTALVQYLEAPVRHADPITSLDALMAGVFTQHQRADVPIGLFLSGGVDSTVLLGLMRRYGMEDIHTFSIGFPGSSVGDELDVATRLATHFGTHHRVITPTPDTLLSRLLQTVWAADDLMRDPANLPTLLLAEEAAKTMKVVFSGEGGDESFAGYGRYRTGIAERFMKRCLFPGTGGFRARGDLRGSMARQLLGPDLQAARAHWRTPLIESWKAYPARWSALQKMQALDLEHALPNNLLVKADRMLMAHGVEGRMPFVDRRIVEWGLMLPDSLKSDRHEGKKILKQWAAGFMPTEHFAAKKRGFYVPVNDWWRGDRLKSLGQILLSNESIKRWFDPKGVSLVLATQQRSGGAGRMLMSLLQFALWHRLFVESTVGELPEQIDPLTYLSD